MASAPATATVPALVQRTYQNPDDGSPVKIVYRCLACALEFDAGAGIGEAAAHMEQIHGQAVVAQSGPKVASIATSPPKIVKTTYHCHQPDGTVVLRTSLSCPQSCGAELDNLAMLRAHLLEAHGLDVPALDAMMGEDGNSGGYVSTQETGTTSDHHANGSGANKRRVVRRLLGDGRVCLICPMCGAEHTGEPKEAESALLDHMSAVHGQALSGCGQGPGASADDERLDLLHQGSSEYWHPKREEAKRRLRVVSLGSFCGVKFSIQRLGFGDAHMPFDWIRTTSTGLQHFLRHDFERFFSIATQQDVPGTRLRVFRSELHSFWHDDVTQPAAREKLCRRIDRLLALATSGEDLLFIRSCTGTDELLDVEHLYAALCDRFQSGGRRRILLAAIVDGQVNFEGPLLHEDHPGLVFFAQPLKENAAEPGGDAYCRAISAAVDAALAVPEDDSGPDVGFGLRGSTSVSVRDLVPVLASDGASDSVCPLRRRPPLVFCDAGLQSGYDGVACFENPGVAHVDLAD